MITSLVLKKKTAKIYRQLFSFLLNFFISKAQVSHICLGPDFLIFIHVNAIFYIRNYHDDHY